MFNVRLRYLGAVVATAFFLASGGNAVAANADVTIGYPYNFTDSVTGTGNTNINVGDTVTWHWSDSDHSTTSGTCTNSGGLYGGTCTPDGTWDSGLSTTGTVFSHTFLTAGTFKYFCSNHLSMMTGKVVASAVVPPPPPPPPPAVSCTPDAVTLCIDDVPGDKRFKIQVHFETVQGGGQSGDGKAVPLTDVGVTQGGLFWLFSANNPEFLIKIANFCVINQHWWIFASAATNVSLTITVTDTSDGTVWTYINPDKTLMPSIVDQTAFSNCQ